MRIEEMYIVDGFKYENIKWLSNAIFQNHKWIRSPLIIKVYKAIGGKWYYELPYTIVGQKLIDEVSIHEIMFKITPKMASQL